MWWSLSTGARGGRKTPRSHPPSLDLFSRRDESMENAELLVVILGAVLPLYPALWFIDRKIGEYDVICAEFVLIREEYRRLRENQHGT